MRHKNAQNTKNNNRDQYKNIKENFFIELYNKINTAIKKR